MILGVLWAVLFYGWIASEAALAIVTYTRRTAGDVQDHGSLLVLWLAIGASISLGTWYGDSHAHTIFHGAPWVRLSALTLMAIALLLRWTAIVQLGQSFSVNVAIHAAQTVQKTGLFRFMRHPSYTAMLFIFLAIGLFTRNWLAVAILVIPPTAALLYRIHVEERALRTAFGTEYIAYTQSTKRLIPGIY